MTFKSIKIIVEMSLVKENQINLVAHHVDRGIKILSNANMIVHMFCIRLTPLRKVFFGCKVNVRRRAQPPVSSHYHLYLLLADKRD